MHAVQRNTNGKATAHSRFGFDGNIAVHHADELFTYRQPQTGPLEVALHAGPHLEERVKQAHHLFCRDPFARIAHANLQVIPGTLHVQDDAAGVGKLNGVAQQVRNDLLQTHRIAGHQLRNVRLDKAVEPQLFTYHQR